jgi:hypothetical protein
MRRRVYRFTSHCVSLGKVKASPVAAILGSIARPERQCREVGGATLEYKKMSNGGRNDCTKW